MLVQDAYAHLSTIDLVVCLDWFFLSNKNIETPPNAEESSTSKSYTYVCRTHIKSLFHMLVI
jgi:hypothetical protein